MGPGPHSKHQGGGVRASHQGMGVVGTPPPSSTSIPFILGVVSLTDTKFKKKSSSSPVVKPPIHGQRPGGGGAPSPNCGQRPQHNVVWHFCLEENDRARKAFGGVGKAVENISSKTYMKDKQLPLLGHETKKGISET